MSVFGAQFLRSPDLFPARMAGETWGDAALDVTLAGDGYRISGLTGRQRDELVARFGDGPAAGMDAFELKVYRVAAEDFLTIDTRGWEYMLDIEPRGEAVAIAGMRLMARLDLDRRSGAVWTAGGDGEFLEIVENVLRPLVAIRLLAQGGLLVHSSAVAIEGRGFLFAARSGAGKSTISRLATESGLPVLSDDLNAVVRNGAGFTVTPLPFTGELSRGETSDRSVPLHALLRLEQGSEESVHPLSGAAAVALLVASAPYVNRDPGRTELLLDRASQIVAAARRATLTFRRDGDPWPILRALR